ncbi:MAG: hypothetical protein MJE68_16890, partial [Proteobacteria bacterium]|nr:hypothetical protein [Pseudomonadota bacterium]
MESPDERVLFPEEIFTDVEPEEVERVPYNINGNHSYIIRNISKKWHKAQEDGRWWEMHTSTVRRRRLTRKIGKCYGSYICQNDECPKFKSGKGRNTYAFTNVGFNLFECKTCGFVAEREFCGALKLTQFHPDANILEVLYAGTHSCTLKERAPSCKMTR